MSKRRPHRRRDPNRARNLAMALILARQALSNAHRQLPTMDLPSGADRRGVTLELEGLMAAYESRLRRITGRKKDSEDPA